MSSLGSPPDVVPLPGHHLSSRASSALKPGLKYFKAFGDAMQRPWSPEDPEGVISIVVAENKLSAGMLHERLQRCAPPPIDSLFYAKDMTGLAKLRQGLADLLCRTFMEGISVDPNHLTLQAGAGAILDNLFWCIGKAGQGVLIPQPYYPQFDSDLGIRCGMVALPFELTSGAGSVADRLDRAAAVAAANGTPVKALLLTNPNNPLSTMYSRETLVDALRWCMANEVHLVSDEIYALSVWGEDAPRFESLECIARAEASSMPGGEERARDLLHIVFGLAKDFCASGLRFGCLHSRNTSLNQAMFSLTYFCMCSGHTQWLLAEIFADTEWLDGFLIENARRLRHSFGLLSAALKEAGIPFVQSDSAMFCWVDLREGLVGRRQRSKEGTAAGVSGDQGVNSWVEERELWMDMMYKHSVLLTPGEDCHATEPGFFRLCWAWVPPEALKEAVGRMKAAMDS